MPRSGQVESGTSISGVLECPQRSGYVLFEFVHGDRLSDLFDALKDEWHGGGQWVTQEERYKNRLPLDREPPGYFQGWKIAVEAEDGTFVLLNDSDQLPTKPPASSASPIEFSKGRRYEGAPLRSGETADMALSRGVYHTEWLDEGLSQEASKGRPFRVQVARAYEMPDRASYDVHFIAFLAVHGG